jgi:hypothetical protein
MGNPSTVVANLRVKLCYHGDHEGKRFYTFFVKLRKAIIKEGVSNINNDIR